MATTFDLTPNRLRSASDIDPFDVLLRPPENESAQDRAARLAREEQAQRVSDRIDDMLAREKLELRKKREVRVLLLGQSESGKSTTLKQFQLLHTPAAFNAERVAWRYVIYLNLVRSVRRILEAIAPEDESTATDDASELDVTDAPAPATAVADYPRYDAHLAPLLALEDTLIMRLSDPDAADEDGARPGSRSSQNRSGPASPASAASSDAGAAPRSPLAPSSPVSPGAGGELRVPQRSNWKKAFALGGRLRVPSPKGAHTNEIEGWWEDARDPVHVLHALAPRMEEMWRDPAVRARLKERRIRLEESSGFYLDEIDRVTAKMYFPTDADVLKARLKTTGVVEHTFTIKPSHESRGVDWKIYDVGGERSQRHAWVPYFEDVNAIIFLAPISTFDQALTEDPTVNRLEDSLLLWKSIVSNKLLASVNIVLFLNKCDLLQRKLASGVRLNEHMVSYGDRPNDYDAVSKYFKNKFGALHQANSTNKERGLFIHMTSVTDTRGTAVIIHQVRDIILTAHLKYSHFV